MLKSKEIEEEPHRTLKSELSYLFVQNEKFAEAVYKGAAQWHQGISAEKIEDHAEEATKYINLIRNFCNRLVVYFLFLISLYRLFIISSLPGNINLNITWY